MSGARNPEIQRVLAALNSSSAHSVGSSNGAATSAAGLAAFRPPPEHTRSPSIPGFAVVPIESQHRPVTPPPLHRQASPATFHVTQKAADDDLPKTVTPSIPDATAITTWRAALKHVTRHLAQSEQFGTRIRHLIAEQHRHERQWWAGREALVARQQGRSGTSQQVSALLKSLGGKEIPLAPSDPAAHEAELAAYDQKVYAGLMAMTADFDRQLRDMGVPFFAIKRDLVIAETAGPTPGAVPGRLDRAELRKLQKKMIQTLEDLFAE